MKLIIIMFLLLSHSAFSTNYYVSNTGSDAANGLTTGTAWQTIAKVNSSTFSAGDSILFKKGDIWVEALRPQNSGNVSNQIVFGAYGTGNKPIITGLQTLSGWANEGSNIWSITASGSVAYQNTVVIDGKIRAKGRYPNNAYLTYTSHSGRSQITGALTGTPDYTGGEAVVRVFHWLIDVSKITSQSSGTLNLAAPLTYEPYNGYGYFIQNIPSVLDTLGEWCIDSTTKVIKVYATSSPNVQISTIDTLIKISSHDYITFDGLSLQGANKAGFHFDTSRHITIQNCSINYSGTIGISAAKSAYITIQNDSIQNSLSGGIYIRRVDPYTPMEDTCNNALIDNNYIKNTAIFSGMGLSDNGRYNAVNVVGTTATVTNNRIDSVGYIGVIWQGTNALVKHNYISNFCLQKTEGGGIYTFTGGAVPSTFSNGSIVRSNIITGATVNGTAGIPLVDENNCAGVYIDGSATVQNIDSNTVINCLNTSYFFNGTYCINFLDNTAIDSIGYSLYASSLGMGVTNMNRNIFYAQSTTWQLWFVGFGIGVFAPIKQAGGTIDSNYYLRPVLETNKFRVTSSYYSLPGWKTYTTFDSSSVSTPSGITSALPLIYYNTTQSNSTISLSGLYYDAKGAPHNNSIVIPPFQSAILFKSTAEVPVDRNFNRVSDILIN